VASGWGVSLSSTNSANSVQGGQKLKAFLEGVSDKLRNGSTLKVGFLAGATYPDGKPVAMIAAIQNFGAPRRNIPPRPFFTNMIKAESSGWAPLLAVELVKGKYDAVRALNRLGAVMKGQLQRSIRIGPWQPLAGVTVARRMARYSSKSKSKKKHDRPLIDTGHMLNSVDWTVSGWWESTKK
jgi:hypothetical protein